MSAMPMPIAELANTARKRASLVHRACSAVARAANAVELMRCCSMRVRSCSAWAYPAANAPCTAASRAASRTVVAAGPSCSPSTTMLRSSDMASVKWAPTSAAPTR